MRAVPVGLLGVVRVETLVGAAGIGGAGVAPAIGDADVAVVAVAVAAVAAAAAGIAAGSPFVGHSAWTAGLPAAW